MTATIGETIAELHSALSDYIEATYHISDQRIVEQRRTLLREQGVILQEPFIESTPRYKLGTQFGALGLDQAVGEMLEELSREGPGGDRLLFNPPYTHQARALSELNGEDRSLVVATGTGSGKTESFLLPILSTLAREASSAPTSFNQPAVRAILLYPMNALVNDQLGRLRLLFGDPRVVERFVDWSGRPARFARYTSRTLYPGVRTSKRDSQRLAPINGFYIRLLNEAADPDAAVSASAQQLIENLQQRGKWPAKPDLLRWYGRHGSRWTNSRGEFVRAVTQPDDAELFTRHEVLRSPPDVLVTNYSMLEYMLMRPLERPIFDRTAEWLRDNAEARLSLVVDEAHLYRGASGAEVGLLIRRLAARLGTTADRLRVICTSASFNSQEEAQNFAAQLVGTAPDRFVVVTGDLALRDGERKGTTEEADRFASFDLPSFYEARDEDRRFELLGPLLNALDVAPNGAVAGSLYEALHAFGPMSLLINLTMQEATPHAELATRIFEASEDVAERALTALVALGSIARRRPDEPGLLPCRVHTFFRGLPGLWACLNQDCDATSPGGAIGRLYGQPRDTCDDCGSRVFEFYTCRHCGSAYARGYVQELAEPNFLWSEPGASFTTAMGTVEEFAPLDICLESNPPGSNVEPADLDLITGRLNPYELGERVREVFIRADRVHAVVNDEDEEDAVASGEFIPCAVCGRGAQFGRTSVQDHQTKGDQPFQALIARQIEVQPPNAADTVDSSFAPLRGRKVLAFADSRQGAARLAPNLQRYSTQDVLRPLIIAGFTHLSRLPLIDPLLTLEDTYRALLVSAAMFDVRLRPKLRAGESFSIADQVRRKIHNGGMSNPADLMQLALAARSATVPESMMRLMLQTIVDSFYGLQSLGLASVKELDTEEVQSQLQTLPPVPGVAETEDSRTSLVRIWLNKWTDVPALWFDGTPVSMSGQRDGVRSHKGKFKALQNWLGTADARRVFERDWLPRLLQMFCEQRPDHKYRLRANNVRLDLGGGWAYCSVCRTTQRPFPESTRCVTCGRDAVRHVDPDTDPVFKARKGYYRAATLRAMAEPPVPPMALIAAEHTAQLNTAQVGEVFSRAEEHELLFQDVDLGPDELGSPRTAIDVLSCTTTMEVGIDIGTLSGVALRSMPPSRASYQQRSGRAGRRGNALATVVAFGSSDSHDEHYFTEPDKMIRGKVEDPILSLDNEEIARRHVTAFLLQRYHQDRLPEIAVEDQPPSLFEVLGTVGGFLSSDAPLNRGDFGDWLTANESSLRKDVDAWLPTEIDVAERQDLLDGIVGTTLALLDSALGDEASSDRESGPPAEDHAGEETALEVPSEVDAEDPPIEHAYENLLDRLLYKGVLPRYAFPTDVASFYVFDAEASTRFRPAISYAPSQGLAVALSQYAPGKEVWIDGKLFASGAIYSQMTSERVEAWQTRRLYFECQICRYARTFDATTGERGELRDCPACGSSQTFGEARSWMRPPGFAHPADQGEFTSADDQPARSYATRAKLVAGTPSDPAYWEPVSPRIQRYSTRDHLLVTNSGPKHEGYSYCTRCGRIEPAASPTNTLLQAHPKPYPDPQTPACPGGATARNLVLGTDFVSDVLLVSLAVDDPVTLRPGLLATEVALRTVSEALTHAATRLMALEPGELQAEYRPALSSAGSEGREAEVYVYDTLAGGAGFSRRAGDLGAKLFEEALEVLQGCPGGCDRSCYRCLRSFRNRFEHDLLDRHLGAALLRYALYNTDFILDEARLTDAADRLFEDLLRQPIEGLELSRHALVEVPGIGGVVAPILMTLAGQSLIVDVHAPLTPDHIHNELLEEVKEYGSVPVVLVDEIVVARNLPEATTRVQTAVQQL